MKEFIAARKSFSQKAFTREIPSGAHCVLMIGDIRKSANTQNKRSYLMEVSDGSYTMTVFVNENEKRFNDDQELISMIENGLIQVG